MNNRIDQLLQMLNDSPDDNFLLHALALEYVKMSDDEKANELWTKLLDSSPDYIAAYYHLAKLYERTGAKEKAIEYYQKGMEMAKYAGDQRTFNELRSAYEELIY